MCPPLSSRLFTVHAAVSFRAVFSLNGVVSQEHKGSNMTSSTSFTIQKALSGTAGNVPPKNIKLSKLKELYDTLNFGSDLDPDDPAF